MQPGVESVGAEQCCNDGELMEQQQGLTKSSLRGDIAIVGVACTYPGARTAGEFWQNIVNKVDAVTDVTPDRWDPDIFYDPDPATEDRIYCKKGGWIGGTYSFNPFKYGIMPAALEGAEADHFLVLRTAYEALDDAGYSGKKIEGLRASVILGKGNYTGPGVTALMYRSIVTEQILAILQGMHPEFTETDLANLKAAVRASLPRLTPEGSAGLIPNICTGRVANRLDLMGRNFTVDAACASSLIATELGVQDLQNGKEDLVIVGGVHIFAHIPFLQVFDTMRALSLSSTIKPYDEDCDGTIAGEGVGMLVLKRIEDAERDGDRIYAVIKGAGSSSDGRAKGVVAPRVEGEELALRRAFEASDIDPRTLGLIEGHGTGTPAGDAAEIEALRRVFGDNEKDYPTCALGSVKSMIGHAMPAAGAAGLIKTALALYHRVLPPTLHCDKPRPELLEAGSPFYINTEARPWVHGADQSPRRAGVNAFGFGGVNAHVVLEEYVKDHAAGSSTLLHDWNTEVFVVEGESRAGLVSAAELLADYAGKVQGVRLCDLAFTLNTQIKGLPERLTIVASSLSDLSQKLAQARTRLLDSSNTQIKDRQGIYYFSDSGVRGGKVAMVFPGEGSQYLNMLSELCMHFPEVRASFDLADAATTDPNRRPPSALIFPAPSRDAEEIKAAEDRLWTIDRATEAVLTTDAAVFALLSKLGIKADMMAGHSAGEWIAMAAAGVLDTEEFIGSLSRLAGMYEKLSGDTEIPRMSMLAVGTGRTRAEKLAGEIDREIHVANDNCNHQVVIVVQPEDEQAVVGHFQQNGVFVEKLPYDRGYHTPAFTYICDPLREYFSSLKVRPPAVPLYSCSTAELFPAEPRAILDVVAETFARPLVFRQMIENMYENGARTFIEVGPRGNLTAFVDDVLRGRPHLSVAIDQYRRPGLATLNHAIGLLAAAHIPLEFGPLYARRSPKMLTLDPVADRVLDEAEMPGTVQVSTCYPRLGIPTELPQSAGIAASAGTAKAAAASASAISVPSVPSVMASPPPVDRSDWQSLPEEIPAPQPITSNGSAPASAGYAASSLEYTAALDDHVSLMEEFLRTHEAVMAGFLGSAVPAASYSEPQLAHSMDFSEVAKPAVAAAMEPVPAPPIAAAAPDPPVAIVVAPKTPQLGDVLLRIVSERTGYPEDMLGLDLDMEADLGIDSIKRVEILAALRDAGEAIGVSAEVEMEEVAKLKTLRQVLQVIGGGGNASVPEAARTFDPAEALRHLPLIRSSSVLEHVPGQSVRLRCEVDSNEHLYLEDHCLYFEASERGNQASPLLSMPMTGSLELMAETATLLRPGLRVIGAKNVQALRWINLKKDGGVLPLSVTASSVDDQSVRVAIRHESSGKEQKPSEVLAEAVITFGTEFPKAAPPKPFKLANRREPVFTAQTLYSDHLMFHGPSFQGVASLDGVGDNGVLGELTVLPNRTLLGSDPDPKFLIDPFFLDAGGQLVGYWPVEYMSEGYVALPIRIGELTLYRPLPGVGSVARCEVTIQQVTPRQFKADYDVIGPDGMPWMHVAGWEDWRFYWERHIHEFWRFPDRASNGKAVTLSLPDGADLVCQRIDPMGEMDKTGLWEVLWMHMILNRRELEEYQGIEDANVRAGWIFERATAKDAVRMWMKNEYGRMLYPADVEIIKDADGRLRASGHWQSEFPAEIFVSACRAGRVGVGAAGRQETAISAFPVNGANGTHGALSEVERSYLQTFGGGEGVARLDAAKAAASQIIGSGTGAEVMDADSRSGSVTVRKGSGEGAKVYTTRSDELVIAIAVREGNL